MTSRIGASRSIDFSAPEEVPTSAAIGGIQLKIERVLAGLPKAQKRKADVAALPQRETAAKKIGPAPSLLSEAAPAQPKSKKDEATEPDTALGEVRPVLATAIPSRNPILNKLSVRLLSTYHGINADFYEKRAERRYSERLMQHGVTGSPLRDPSGRPCKGKYKRAEKAGNRAVALLSSLDTDAQKRVAKSEAELLDKVQDGPHFPEQIDHFGTDKRYASIQENVGPSLFAAYLDRENPALERLTMWDVERIGKQLLEGLFHLHKKGILHGDVKPENCSKNGHLIDFSLAGAPGTRLRYTRNYRPPENVLRVPTSFSGDMWALGCLLFELVKKTPLIPVSDNEGTQADINMIHAYQSRLNGRLNHHALSIIRQDLFLDGPWGKQLKPSTLTCPLPQYAEEIRKHLQGPYIEDFIDLLSKLLQTNPEKRITAEQALEHPFFTSLRSTDRSFKLAVTQSKMMKMRILNHGRKVLDTIDFSTWNPSRCYHILKSSQPYTLEFFEPAKPDTVVHTCPLSIARDRQIIAINTDTFTVSPVEDLPPASALPQPN